MHSVGVQKMFAGTGTEKKTNPLGIVQILEEEGKQSSPPSSSWCARGSRSIDIIAHWHTHTRHKKKINTLATQYIQYCNYNTRHGSQNHTILKIK